MNEDEDSPPNETELMLTIACLQGSTDADEERQAEEAFTELYRRHEESLRKIVAVQLRKYSTFRFEADEIFILLCQKIWRNAESYNPQDGQPLEVTKQFFGWCKTICTNIVIDLVRGIQIDLDYRDLQALEKTSPLAETVSLSEKAQIAALALKNLSEADQDILRALAENVRFDGKNRRSNSDELKQLADSLNVTVASLRVKRQRAVQKFKTELEKIAAAAVYQ